MKKYFPLLALSLLTLSTVSVVAYRDSQVLGASTKIAEVVFPPITAGPGHILPDSPLYPLDKLYQAFRLGLVFSPENRAQLHTQIAAERLAELRVEASRNDQVAADTALIELEHESMAAANDIRDAAAQGKDVKQLARDIHQSLADYRTILNAVIAQVPDSAFSQKLVASAGVLRNARIISEDALPEEDIDHEIAASVDAQVDEAVLGIATSTKTLEKTITMYEQYASSSANKSSSARKQQIVELRKRITELQTQLNRLLLLQAQDGKDATHSSDTRKLVAKPTVTPLPTRATTTRK